VLTADQQVVELDWEGRAIQQFGHPYPLQFNRSMHSSAFPFAYFEWPPNNSQKKKSYLIDREGKQHLFPEEYWYPSVLPAANVPTIGQDLLYDDFSFYQENGDLLFSIPKTQPSQASSNYRAFIFTDKGDFWTGGDFGLQKISIRKNPFKNYLKNEKGELNAIRGILADRESIFLNVEHLGPTIIDRATGNARPIEFASKGFGNYALQKLKDGRIAFGHSRFLGLTDVSGKPPEFFPVGFYTWAIFQASENTVWLGTEAGLQIFDPTRNEVRPFEEYNSFNDLRSAHITHIAASRDGRIWLCTNKGFFQADREKGIIAQYSKNQERPFRIPHDVIYHFYEESLDTFWLASGGGGLIQLVLGNDQPAVRQFTQFDGLSNDVIYAVYPDSLPSGKAGGGSNLWLSSDQGIMRFHEKTGEVQTFLEEDGLPNNEFNRISHFQAADGQIFFGTINGATTFHPVNLENVAVKDEPPLRITSYQQFDGEENRMVERTNELLQNMEIVLSPNDRFFRLELALLTFHQVSKNQFAYRFTGMSNEWEYTSERTLRFGRLPFGKYELQIKAQDVRGHWSASELHIPVTVLRPFYLQTWFIGLAIGTLLFGAFLFYKIRTQHLKERQRELEKTVAERTQKIRDDKAIIEQQAEELQSLEKLKSRFFANVSHELRTPLSLMIGPLDSILKKESNRPEKELRLLEFVRNNSKHLLKLVNEILDLSKLETGRLEVKEEAVNFHDFLQPLVSQFSSFGDSESVKMKFDYQADPKLNLLLDTNKFEKIVHNFLSNAIKFSPAGAVVYFKVVEENNHLLVSVTDSGPGIHPDDLPHIFDRFYQSKQVDAPTQGGTGIGLSLANELAELLGGKIWAESEMGKGSVFFFRFPMKLVSSPQSSVPSLQSAVPSLQSAVPSPQSAATNVSTGTKTDELKPTILIVEDNPELRSYMQVLLEDDYHLITAENGKVAWEFLSSTFLSSPVRQFDSSTVANADATKDCRTLERKTVDCQLPTADCELKSVDLIISDLMMPIMDGFQLLEKIKAHETLRHLPVIMLTARADVRVKLRALRIGVDDYLTKPFVEEELQVRIKNLLQNYRERVKAMSEGPSPALPQGEGATAVSTPLGGGREGANMAATDANWLEEVEAVFSKKLPESQFTMEWVANEMHLSSRQFGRRLKQLTGLTPNNYLREMRLQRAKDFLHEGKYTSVKEVGFAVGFSSTKYFSNLFQERFGVLPSEYLS
jgi:signal transduction histidine kinase/CheY-like chemotaxis protein/AraC-like DNA-binding protein